MQDVPDPPAVQVWTPELNEVSARFPAVPPEATVVLAKTLAGQRIMAIAQM